MLGIEFWILAILVVVAPILISWWRNKKRHNDYVYHETNPGREIPRFTEDSLIEATCPHCLGPAIRSPISPDWFCNRCGRWSTDKAEISEDQS